MALAGTKGAFAVEEFLPSLAGLYFVLGRFYPAINGWAILEGARLVMEDRSMATLTFTYRPAAPREFILPKKQIWQTDAPP